MKVIVDVQETKHHGPAFTIGPNLQTNRRGRRRKEGKERFGASHKPKEGQRQPHIGFKGFALTGVERTKSCFLDMVEYDRHYDVNKFPFFFPKKILL